MTVRHLAVMAGVLAALTGCSVSTAGSARPSDQLATSTPTSHTPSPDLLPPRQRELDLTGVDPCKDLLTDKQLRELVYDLGYERSPRPSTSDIHDGPGCSFSSSRPRDQQTRDIGSLVGVSVTEGAEAWLTDPARKPDKPPEIVDIEGFSALVLPHPKLPDNCMVVVDTAESQYLEVSSSPDTGEGTSVEPYCAEAERVAGMAIQTLSASR